LNPIYIFTILFIFVFFLKTFAFCDTYSDVQEFFKSIFSFYNQIEEGSKSPYTLWKPDDNISEINNFKTNITSDNSLIFSGYDQNSKKLKAEFKKTGDNKGTIELFYNGTKQLICEETFKENHECQIYIKCPINNDNYIKIIITDPDTTIKHSKHKLYQIKIETMGENFVDEISFDMNNLAIFDNINVHRKNIKPSSIEIAALNHEFLNNILMEIEDEEIVLGLWQHILNHIGAAGTDFIGGIGTTIIAHGVSELICPDELH